MAKKPRVKRDDFAEVVTHPKYLGYDVGAPEPDGWTFAAHPIPYDIHVRPFPLGIRLNCAVHIGAEPGNSRYTRQVFAVAMDFWHEDLNLIRRRPEFPADDRDKDDEEPSGAAAGNGSRSNVH